MLALNLFLAIAWVALTGEVTLLNLLVGFVLGYVALFGVQRTVDPQSALAQYVCRVPRIGRLAAVVIWSIIVANLQMALVVVSPLRRLRPAIVPIPLDLTTPAAVTFLANWITLTPGTLSLDVSPDQSVLTVHTIDVGESPEAFRRAIKERFERRLLELYL